MNNLTKVPEILFRAKVYSRQRTVAVLGSLAFWGLVNLVNSWAFPKARKIKNAGF